MFTELILTPNNYCNKGKLPMAFFACCLAGFMMLSSCAPKTTVTKMSLMSPAETSHQLLPGQYLAHLNDKLTVKANPTYPEEKIEFTVINRSLLGMTIEFSGQNGSYTFVTEPKRDETWLLNTGTYHVELSVPGFPTTAADNLVISAYHKYKWEIWKTKH